MLFIYTFKFLSFSLNGVESLPTNFFLLFYLSTFFIIEKLIYLDIFLSFAKFVYLINFLFVGPFVTLIMTLPKSLSIYLLF